MMALNHTLRSEAYRELGQPQRALEDLEEAIRIKPKFAAAFRGRALTYTLLGKEVEAQQAADRAVELGVDQPKLEAAIQELKEQR